MRGGEHRRRRERAQIVGDALDRAAEPPQGALLGRYIPGTFQLRGEAPVDALDGRERVLGRRCVDGQPAGLGRKLAVEIEVAEQAGVQFAYRRRVIEHDDAVAHAR